MRAKSFVFGIFVVTAFTTNASATITVNILTPAAAIPPAKYCYPTPPVVSGDGSYNPVFDTAPSQIDIDFYEPGGAWNWGLFVAVSSSWGSSTWAMTSPASIPPMPGAWTVSVYLNTGQATASNFTYDVCSGGAGGGGGPGDS